MPIYEHATSIGVWFFKALVESSKLRQMTFNEEAAHHNKPNSRYQSETRFTAGAPEFYATHDAAHVLILQGVHVIIDEAAVPQDHINAYVPYPQGVGLAPFLRRPVPVVNGFRANIDVLPPTPTLANLSFHNREFSTMNDTNPNLSFYSMPETSVGVIGIDAGTDFKTSLVIAHRWSNNESGEPPGLVYRVGYLFWRVIGHVAAY